MNISLLPYNSLMCLGLSGLVTATQLGRPLTHIRVPPQYQPTMHANYAKDTLTRRVSPEKNTAGIAK